jgi:hypothetical protein
LRRDARSARRSFVRVSLEIAQMSYVNSDWSEHQRKRWLRPDWQRWVRHDAHRFAPPGSSAPESHAARLIEQRKAQEEEAAHTAQQDALREDLFRLRRELADIKLELALRRIFRKYSADQPRVPKGNTDGGQWTKEGGGDAGKDPSYEDLGGAAANAEGLVLSDASPDPIRPRAQYAQTTVNVDRALTGIEDVDRTTKALAERLAKVVDSVPKGFGRFYGTAGSYGLQGITSGKACSRR